MGDIKPDFFYFHATGFCIRVLTNNPVQIKSNKKYKFIVYLSSVLFWNLGLSWHPLNKQPSHHSFRACCLTIKVHLFLLWRLLIHLLTEKVPSLQAFKWTMNISVSQSAKAATIGCDTTALSTHDNKVLYLQRSPKTLLLQTNKQKQRNVS